MAAHRQQRPWTGAVSAAGAARPAYDPDCYLCPGNARVGGARQPALHRTFVFDNDHPCVGADAPRDLTPPAGLPDRAGGRRRARRVLLAAPRSDAGRDAVDAVDASLEMWQQQTRELGARPEVAGVLSSRTRATSSASPTRTRTARSTRRSSSSRRSRPSCSRDAGTSRETGRGLMADIIRPSSRTAAASSAEDEQCHRVRALLRPLRLRGLRRPQAARRARVRPGRRRAAGSGAVLRDVVIRFDNLWRMSFPYVMVLHQAPAEGRRRRFPFLIAFHPPLRQPHLLKYLAGPEIGGGNFLSDTSPEAKAAELRAQAAALQADAIGMTRRRGAARAIPPCTRHPRRGGRRVRAPSRRAVGGGGRRRGRHDVRRRPRGRDVLLEEIGANDRARDAVPARGRRAGRRAVVVPAGGPTREDGAGRHRRPDRRHARPDVPEAPGLDADRRRARPGRETLADIALAVQTEIPLVKQHLCDTMWAVAGGASRRALQSRHGRARAADAAAVARDDHRPGLRRRSRASSRAPRRAGRHRRRGGRGGARPAAAGKAHAFEDQYISTGGQLYELMGPRPLGRRPAAADRAAAGRAAPALCSHPYDLCTELIAREAGVIVTDPRAGAGRAARRRVGRRVGRLRQRRLRAQVEPHLRRR